MRVGWMWFDDDPGRSLQEKIERAVKRYQERYGRLPTACYVNKKHVTGEGFRCGNMKVIPAPNILPHHFFLGVEVKRPSPQPSPAGRGGS